jgi:DNA-binding NarL/FixJ family response regulator
VGTTSDDGAVVALAGQLHPAVVVVDARMAQLDGLTVTRSLYRQPAAPPVVVLSVYGTLRDQALAAGACRFLLKDCSRAELVAAIRLAAQGQCQANVGGLDRSPGVD